MILCVLLISLPGDADFHARDRSESGFRGSDAVGLGTQARNRRRNGVEARLKNARPAQQEAKWAGLLSLRIVGFELDRPVVVAESIFQATQLLVENPEVRVRAGFRRIELDGAEQIFFALFMSIQAGERRPQTRQRNRA